MPPSVWQTTRISTLLPSSIVRHLIHGLLFLRVLVSSCYNEQPPSTEAINRSSMMPGLPLLRKSPFLHSPWQSGPFLLLQSIPLSNPLNNVTVIVWVCVSSLSAMLLLLELWSVLMNRVPKSPKVCLQRYLIPRSVTPWHVCCRILPMSWLSQNCTCKPQV